MGEGDCERHGAMPLYWFAIGGFVKSIIISTISLQLAFQSWHSPFEHLSDEELVRQRIQFHRKLEEREGSKTSVWNRPCFQKLKNYLLISWEAYLILSMLIQAGFDVLHVASYESSSSWDGYSCFALVTANSPNVSTVIPSLPENLPAVISPFALMPIWYFDSLESRESSAKGVFNFLKRWRERIALFLLIALLLPTLVTHVLVFLFPIYFWVTAIGCVGVSLFVFVYRSTSLAHNERTYGDIHWNIVRAIGPSLHLTFLLTTIPLGASTMVRWYSAPHDYIGSLKEALLERSLKEFLSHKSEQIHRGQQLFSVIQYFF